MSRPGPARLQHRRRLAGPALTAAGVALSIASLGALHLWAGQPGAAQRTSDALAMALLRAELERDPADVHLRLRLVRQQLALGMYRDAERTLVPLYGAGVVAPPESALLSLDAALGIWRAIPPGLPERHVAEESALARLEAFLPRQASLDALAHAARVARELGRPDLAARAEERAASLEPDPRRAKSLGFAAVDAYRAAESGDQALRLIEKLVDRFPAERDVLERALAVALAQNDGERARSFGERLLSVSAFDTVSLGRQLDLELAAGHLPGALDAAERLVAKAPRDRRSRATAARVATWAGRPRHALLHWTWLAKHGGSLEDVDEALALARALREESATAELLRIRSRIEPLSPAALAELTHALESTAAPRTVMAALESYAGSRSQSRDAWEALASAQERRRQFAAALATRLEIGRRFGGGLGHSLAVAKLQWAIGRGAEALAELQRWIDSTPPERVEYWEVLAEIAWQQEADPVALRAYGALWESEHIDVAGAERLLLLTRNSGRTDDLIRIGRSGWSRMRQPRLLLLAMDEAARTGRWNDVEAMAAEAAGSGDDFDSLPAYWMLRARADERERRIPQAIGAYRRALEGDPKSKAARAGLLWLLSGAHQRGTLSEYLATWADDASGDPELSRAYLAGLEEMRTASPPLFRSLPAAAGAELASESVAGVVLAQQRAFVRAEIAGGEVELRQGLIAALPNGARLELPGAETRLSAQARLPGFAGQTEATAGISVRSDGNVLQAGVARTQRLASMGEARIEASLHEPADESLALRLEGMRTRVGGAVAVSEGGAYQRIAYDWKSWSTRAGAGVGKGGSANIEIGWRTQSPDVVVRLQGGYQRNWLRGSMPAVLRDIASDPSAVLPAELAAIGVGAGVARLPVGPVRLAADLWIGSVGPPFRPAFRIQTGMAITPLRNGDLAMSAFAANDRWSAGGNLGLSLTLTHRFGM